jgi:hypothetical protein
MERLVQENSEPPKHYAIMSDVVVKSLTCLPQVSFIAPQGEVSDFVLHWLGTRRWRFGPRYPRQTAMLLGGARKRPVTGLN